MLWNIQASPWRRLCAYLLLAFGITWAFEITGLVLSHGLSTGELTAFGVFGPAVAGLILSRSGVRTIAIRFTPRLVACVLVWLVCWVVGYFGIAPEMRARFGAAALALSGMVAVLPAWILTAVLSRDDGVRSYIRTLVLPRSWLWSLLAAVLFAGFLLIPTLLPEAWRGAVSQPQLPGEPIALALYVLLTFSRVFLYSGGVGEETGWHGYMLPTLQERVSPLLASLIVWLFWALWHLPLDITGYVGNTIEAYLDNRLEKVLPLSIIATWLYNRSRGSILTAAIFHTSFNTFPQFFPSAAGTVWILWLWAGLVVILDRMWRLPPTPAPASP